MIQLNKRKLVEKKNYPERIDGLVLDEFSLKFSLKLLRKFLSSYKQLTLILRSYT